MKFLYEQIVSDNLRKGRLHPLSVSAIPKGYVCIEKSWCCQELAQNCNKKNFIIERLPESSPIFAVCCATSLYVEVEKEVPIEVEVLRIIDDKT